MPRIVDMNQHGDDTAMIVIRSKGSDYTCLYDAKDAALIDQFTWSVSSQGYAVTRRAGRSILMHRLILGVVEDPLTYCDHINHNPLDNRRGNLRTCTRAENARNRRKQKSSTNSKGVTRFAGRYFAQITYNNVYHYLGLFRSERTAARVYDAAARRLHGGFACTNDLEPLPEQMRLSI